MEAGKAGSSTESVATVTSEEFVLVQGSPQGSGGKPRLKVRAQHPATAETRPRVTRLHISALYLSQMSWNGSEQLEKAMEEVLDDDEMKVEKSNVEKMEKHSRPESTVPEPPAAGISSRVLRSSRHRPRLDGPSN